MTTLLDPTAALVVIDLQQGILALPAAEDAAAVVSTASRLTRAFRKLGNPVALVSVTGTAPGRTDRTPHAGKLPAGFATLVPELGTHPGDILVQKQRWGAFSTTSLHEELQRRGVTQIVLCGIATSMGIESTARFAHEYGYHVLVVRDAVADPDRKAHAHTITTILPQIAQVRTAHELDLDLAG